MQSTTTDLDTAHYMLWQMRMGRLLDKPHSSARVARNLNDVARIRRDVIERRKKRALTPPALLAERSELMSKLQSLYNRGLDHTIAYRVMTRRYEEIETEIVRIAGK
jgi:hypothetical protein